VGAGPHSGLGMQRDSFLRLNFDISYHSRWFGPLKLKGPALTHMRATLKFGLISPSQYHHMHAIYIDRRCFLACAFI
jgi:hypothetical protein